MRSFVIEYPGKEWWRKKWERKSGQNLFQKTVSTLNNNFVLLLWRYYLYMPSGSVGGGACIHQGRVEVWDPMFTSRECVEVGNPMDTSRECVEVGNLIYTSRECVGDPMCTSKECVEVGDPMYTSRECVEVGEHPCVCINLPRLKGTCISQIGKAIKLYLRTGKPVAIYAYAVSIISFAFISQVNTHSGKTMSIFCYFRLNLCKESSCTSFLHKQVVYRLFLSPILYI